MSVTSDLVAAPPMAESGITREVALADAHSNNFDAIRLVAALLVIFSHQLFFVGKAQPLFAGYSLGEIAVMAFFVISGFLVADSWYRDPHLVRFILRRFLRIWPALAVATLVIALAAVLVSTLPPHEYFRHATWHFIARNLQLKVVYDLPGVFVGSTAPAMAAVNGSWWSIPLEVKCYLYIAVLGLIGLRRRWISLLALAVVGFMCFQTLPGHVKANALHHLKYLCTGFFVTGLCARQFVDTLRRSRIVWVCGGLALLIGSSVAGQHDLLVWVVIAPMVLILGSLSTPWVRSAARFGDLSYGVYIYAYFVQQLSVRYWPGDSTYWGSVAVSILVTTGLAWLSWHAVEAPALGLKRHLRQWFPDRAI
jgi:peptidoglycan/LPS O-acetylase OafA/YrhL